MNKKITAALVLTFLLTGVFTAWTDTNRGPGEDENIMRIQVGADGKTTVFELNGSSAAEELYAQLPLDIPVEDFGGKEKIFYPPRKLDTRDTPPADAVAGTLAYYAPWGDVVLFYADFGAASGLYELGTVLSGAEHIRTLSGTVRVEPLP